MKVNGPKCGLLEILDNQNQQQIDHQLTIQGQIIPQVMEYTYLEVLFNNTLDREKMIKDRVRKGVIKANMYQRLFTSNRVPLEAKSLALNT